jgi:S1-C subfamily serine protease
VSSRSFDVRADRVRVLAVAAGLLALAGLSASADELTPVRVDVERALPDQALDPLFARPELIFRGVPARGPVVYRERVNGVVLIAATKAIGTGVVVSAQGDIVTNEHVVRDAHRAQGSEWIAVWFKPPNGVRPAKNQFFLARVVQRNQRRDLAHIRLAQAMPATASVIPLGVMPDVGQEVFTIGHPKTFLWSFTQGVVSQIRPDYQWRYDDGVARSATAIQTQAAVEPGVSGAPLLDDKGAVVGIVVGSAAEAQGVYFAVSVQHVRELLPR